MRTDSWLKSAKREAHGRQGSQVVVPRPVLPCLELGQLRQRMSVRIWSSYQRYVCARVQYADPTHDTQRQHAYQAEVAAAKQELMAQRHINEAHMHRVGGPTVWGV